VRSIPRDSRRLSSHVVRLGYRIQPRASAVVDMPRSEPSASLDSSCPLNSHLDGLCTHFDLVSSTSESSFNTQHAVSYAEHILDISPCTIPHRDLLLDDACHTTSNVSGHGGGVGPDKGNRVGEGNGVDEGDEVGGGIQIFSVRV
jgi:hypothetical protein